MNLLTTLRRFFGRLTAPGDRLLVAFSGGPDSTALAWGLGQIAPDLDLEILAAHLDHRLDADSPRRAAAAGRLAAALGVPLVVERLDHGLPCPDPDPADLGIEAYARHRRYRFLRQLAEERGARYIATAHHADDQAETVLLRLLFGSGLEGLVGIHRRRGRVVRPLLDLRRRDLLEALAASGLEAVADPTNADLGTPRNRVRHRLLPALAAADRRIVDRLSTLARAAVGARRRVEETLVPILAPRRLETAAGAAIDRRPLARLPEPLLTPALALLSRHAGAPYPPGAPARRELLRQLARGGRIGCDCGAGWRWEGDAASLRMRRREPKVGEFAYTLRVPGEVEPGTRHESPHSLVNPSPRRLERKVAPR